MAVRETLHCVLCGHDRPLKAFRLTPEGAFEGPARELFLRIDTIGGRAKLTVDRVAVPLYFALGMRAALKAALASIEADIEEATGEPLED